MSGELSCSACLRPENLQSGGVVVENPEFAIRADIVFLAQHRYRIQLSGRAGLSVVSADNQVRVRLHNESNSNKDFGGFVTFYITVIQ